MTRNVRSCRVAIGSVNDRLHDAPAKYLCSVNASSSTAKRANRWMTSRLSTWRERPLLAALVAGFMVVWALRIPAQNGSKWDSILANAAWALLVCVAVVAIVGRRSSHSE